MGGRPSGTVAKEREALALLRDRAVFRTPYGGSMPFDETGVKDAAYGPAGFIVEGDEFFYLGREAVALLRESLDKLDAAVDEMKEGDLVHRTAWLVIRNVYYTDPADTSLPDVWRRRGDLNAEWHDEGKRILAAKLAHEDLYVVWPKRMNSRKPALVEKMNDDATQLLRQLHHKDAKGKTRSVEIASEITGYSERRLWEIIGIRGWEQE